MAPNPTLPPSNRVEDDPDHTPDHNLLVLALEDLVAALQSPATFQSDAAANVALIAQGAPFQTGDLFNAKDSEGNLLASVDELGQITAGPEWTAVGMLKAVCRAANVQGIKLQGAVGQTANMIRVLDSDLNPVFEVLADGTVNAPNVGTIPGSSPAVTYSPLLVLDAAEDPPAGTLAGTVILRRPA